MGNACCECNNKEKKLDMEIKQYSKTIHRRLGGEVPPIHPSSSFYNMDIKIKQSESRNRNLNKLFVETGDEELKDIDIASVSSMTNISPDHMSVSKGK